MAVRGTRPPFRFSSWVPESMRPKPKAEQLKREQEWFTRQEAAEYLGISYNTLKAWKLPLSRVRNRVRYAKADLDECMRGARYEAGRKEDPCLSQNK